MQSYVCSEINEIFFNLIFLLINEITNLENLQNNERV